MMKPAGGAPSFQMKMNRSGWTPASTAYWFLSNHIFALGYHSKHIRLHIQIHYVTRLFPSRFTQRIDWQSSAARFVQQRVTEVLLCHYVSLPSVVLLLASEETGVRWPHMFKQANVSSTHCKYRERQHAQRGDKASFFFRNARYYITYGMNV